MAMKLYRANNILKFAAAAFHLMICSSPHCLLCHHAINITVQCSMIMVTNRAMNFIWSILAAYLEKLNSTDVHGY